MFSVGDTRRSIDRPFAFDNNTKEREKLMKKSVVGICVGLFLISVVCLGLATGTVQRAVLNNLGT